MPSLDEVLSKMAPAPADEVVDFENYKDAAEFPAPVPRGEYTLMQDGPPADFTSNAPGQLTAVLHHKIVSGEYDGRKVMYDRVSTKTFERDGARVSQAADYLRAIGSSDRPRTPAEWGTFFTASEGKTWKAVLDWEGSCTPCREAATVRGPVDSAERKKWTLKGESRFPMAPSGGRQYSGVTCPNCGGNTIDARQSIVRRIPA